jgi:hypothetical protein
LIRALPDGWGLFFGGSATAFTNRRSQVADTKKPAQVAGFSGAQSLVELSDNVPRGTRFFHILQGFQPVF